jgi:hypothetical protein
MRDDRERERAVSGRAKQNRTRHAGRIGRGHQPLLAATRLALAALRPRRHLRRGGLHMQRDQRDRHENWPEPSHLPPLISGRQFRSDGAVNQTGRPEGPPRRLVLFRYNRPQQLMHKIHTLTDN